MTPKQAAGTTAEQGKYRVFDYTLINSSTSVHWPAGKDLTFARSSIVVWKELEQEFVNFPLAGRAEGRPAAARRRPPPRSAGARCSSSARSASCAPSVPSPAQGLIEHIALRWREVQLLGAGLFALWLHSALRISGAAWAQQDEKDRDSAASLTW